MVVIKRTRLWYSLVEYFSYKFETKLKHFKYQNTWNLWKRWDQKTPGNKYITFKRAIDKKMKMKMKKQNKVTWSLLSSKTTPRHSETNFLYLKKNKIRLLFEEDRDMILKIL